MKSFLEEYGFAILAAIVVILLIMMISPVGVAIKDSLNSVVLKFTNSTTSGFDSMNFMNDTTNNDDDNLVVLWQGTFTGEETGDTETGDEFFIYADDDIQKLYLLHAFTEVNVIFDGQEFYLPVHENSQLLTYEFENESFDFTYWDGSYYSFDIRTEEGGEHTIVVKGASSQNQRILRTIYDDNLPDDYTVTGNFYRFDVSNDYDFQMIKNYTHILIKVDNLEPVRVAVQGADPAMRVGVDNEWAPTTNSSPVDVGLSYLVECDVESCIIYQYLFYYADPSYEAFSLPSHILIQVDENDRAHLKY